MAALMGLPVSLYIYFYLKNIPPPKKLGKTNYAAHAWKHLADRRVVELCFFTFGYIFVGFVPSPPTSIFLASTLAQAHYSLAYHRSARPLWCYNGILFEPTDAQVLKPVSGGIIVLRSRLRNCLDPLS